MKIALLALLGLALGALGGAALVLVEDLGPGRLDLFVIALDRVVAAIGQAERGQRRQHGQDLAHQISPGGIGRKLPD